MAYRSALSANTYRSIIKSLDAAATAVGRASNTVRRYREPSRTISPLLDGIDEKIDDARSEILDQARREGHDL